MIAGILSWISTNSSFAAVVMMTQLSTGPSVPCHDDQSPAKENRSAPLHAYEIRLPPAGLHPPFVVAVGRYQAAPLSERIPEIRFYGEGLGAGIDRFQYGFFDPVGNKPPVTDGQFPVGVIADNRNLCGRGDVVTAGESRDIGQAVMVCQPGFIALEYKTPTH